MVDPSARPVSEGRTPDVSICDASVSDGVDGEVVSTLADVPSAADLELPAVSRDDDRFPAPPFELADVPAAAHRVPPVVRFGVALDVLVTVRFEVFVGRAFVVHLLPADLDRVFAPAFEDRLRSTHTIRLCGLAVRPSLARPGADLVTVLRADEQFLDAAAEVAASAKPAPMSATTPRITISRRTRMRSPFGSACTYRDTASRELVATGEGRRGASRSSSRAGRHRGWTRASIATPGGATRHDTDGWCDVSGWPSIAAIASRFILGP